MLNVLWLTEAFLQCRRPIIKLDCTQDRESQLFTFRLWYREFYRKLFLEKLHLKIPTNVTSSNKGDCKTRKYLLVISEETSIINPLMNKNGFKGFNELNNFSVPLRLGIHNTICLRWIWTWQVHTYCFGVNWRTLGGQHRRQEGLNLTPSHMHDFQKYLPPLWPLWSPSRAARNHFQLTSVSPTAKFLL